MLRYHGYDGEYARKLFFQFLLGCFSEMLAFTVTEGNITFNSFWDASWDGSAQKYFNFLDFQFLLGCFMGQYSGEKKMIIRFLSIPSGMLLTYYNFDIVVQQNTFNSFWDASKEEPNYQECKKLNFQFLLGCFIIFEDESLRKLLYTFNSFWDASCKKK